MKKLNALLLAALAAAAIAAAAPPEPQSSAPLSSPSSPQAGLADGGHGDRVWDSTWITDPPVKEAWDNTSTPPSVH